MRDSGLASGYIDTGYTIGTYCVYTLRGRAKQWSGRYAKSLLNTMIRWERAGLAVRGKSKRGGLAFFTK